MQTSLASVREWHDVTPEIFKAEIASRYQPAILRGLVRDWPATQRGLESPEALAQYLAQFDSGKPLAAFFGSPEIKGRLFYNEDLSGLNFRQVRAPLKPTIGRILQSLQEQEPPTVYVGASSTAESLPEFTRDNRLGLVDASVVPNIWMGNKVTVAPHFDVPDNLACVVSGRRRVTLFPPEQISNLYVGPIDFTPAGAIISMVSVKDPDLERYPKFAQALEAAQVAELEPGDVLYIPSLWWHNVESLGEFNVLVNYWWDEAVEGAGSPFDSIIHSLLTLSSLPPHKVAAWRHFYEHYVFNTDQHPAEHIPVKQRGPLGKMTPRMAGYVRNYLSNFFRS